MRALILSDLHANWYALEAVLKDAGSGFDQIICCGDIVGYNPHPAQVLDWVRTNCNTVIRGNHDKLVAGLADPEWFNEIALAAAIWTRERLDASQLAYLRALPQGPVVLEHFVIWHGSPLDEDEYVTAVSEARPCFQHFDMALAFFGHTHLQGGFFSRYGRIGVLDPVPTSEKETVIELQPDSLYMVNPGSTGQPRDDDPRAAYAIFDSEQQTVSLRRVAYPVQQTAEDIRRAGLPSMLAQRLFYGA